MKHTSRQNQIKLNLPKYFLICIFYDKTKLEIWAFEFSLSLATLHPWFHSICNNTFTSYFIHILFVQDKHILLFIHSIFSNIFLPTTQWTYQVFISNIWNYICLLLRNLYLSRRTSQQNRMARRTNKTWRKCMLNNNGNGNIKLKPTQFYFK